MSLAYAVGLSVFSAHQEIRFLLPCLPFLHIVAGTVLCDVLAWCYSDSHRYSAMIICGVRNVQIHPSVLFSCTVFVHSSFHYCS